MSQQVWILSARSEGVGTDYFWIVAAYNNQEQAQAHRDLAQAEAHRLERLFYDVGDDSTVSPYDPTGNAHAYLGVQYRVESLTVVRHVDEYLEHEGEGDNAEVQGDR